MARKNLVIFFYLFLKIMVAFTEIVAYNRIRNKLKIKFGVIYMTIISNFGLMMNEKFKGVDARYRDNTIKNYMIDINKFLEYLQEKNTYEDTDKLLIEFTKKDAKEYVKELEEQYKPSTINRKISALMKLYDYIVDVEELMNRNPFTKELKISKIVVDKYKEPKDILTLEECRKLIGTTRKKQYNDKNFSFNSCRDRLLLGIYITNGTRCMELVDATMNDLEKIDKGYVINISEGNVKNKINKRLIITGEVEKYLDDYLVSREVNNINAEKIFTSAKGGNLSNSNINSRIKKYIKIAGIEKNITVHCFRDTCTSILRSNKVSDSLITLILGWKDGSMLNLYSTQDLSIYDSMKAQACNFL